MLKAAIEKILSLDAPHIEEIEGRTYVDKDMTQIGKELRATSITMNNLSSLVDFIKKSKADFKTGHYIAQVVSPTEVRLFSSLDTQTATAEYEGSMDVVTGNITKFMAERDKQKESEIRAQYLAQMPTPQSGNVGQVDYSAQIKQAMDAGDSQAAILAILSQSAANNQQA